MQIPFMQILCNWKTYFIDDFLVTFVNLFLQVLNFATVTMAAFRLLRKCDVGWCLALTSFSAESVTCNYHNLWDFQPAADFGMFSMFSQTKRDPHKRSGKFLHAGNNGRPP